MPDYSNSSVYRIVCKDTSVTESYVGSTCNLRNRIAKHKTTCNNSNNEAHNTPVYVFIREHGGWENWDVVVVESVSCETVKQLRDRERHWLEQIGATLNADVPNRSKAEWTELNREHVRKRQHELYLRNHDERLENQHEYNEKNREKINERQREYNKKNKDKVNAKDRERYQKRKDKLNARSREKITCGCGSVVRRGGKAEHERTDKHKEWLEQQGALGEN